MMVEGSQQKTLYIDFMLLGTRQQGLPVNLRKKMLPDGFDHSKHDFEDIRVILSGIQNKLNCRPQIHREDLTNLRNTRFQNKSIALLAVVALFRSAFTEDGEMLI
ncbi:unnamed protein product [Schistosoma margrebowiei]|uniref:Uncharacterized protein n=1 Tax=Schistosoma margrebowiei TaxID=48269 RepID=A0A183LM69_9TREM|nr:unnamed protein product [Schistosoma margrebowiei]